MSDDGRLPGWDPPPPWDPPPGWNPPPVPIPPRAPKTPRVRLLLIGVAGSVAALLVASVLAGTVHYRDALLARWRPGWATSSSASPSPTASSAPATSGTPQPTATATISTPDSYGTPEHNRIYRTVAMRSVHCHADLRSTTRAAYERFARQVTACLDRAWRPVLESQGIAFRPPHVVVGARPASPCKHDQEVGYRPFAYYCDTDETMYFSMHAFKRDHYSIRDRDYLMETAVHEYGHHVQTLMGLWPYFGRRYEAARLYVDKYTKLSRRMELQPQCFAGMFLGRNASTMHLSERGAKYTAAHTGDDNVRGVKTHPAYRTHGHNRNSGYFFARGWDTGRAASCNTWTAPASRVS